MAEVDNGALYLDWAAREMTKAHYCSYSYKDFLFAADVIAGDINSSTNFNWEGAMSLTHMQSWLCLFRPLHSRFRRLLSCSEHVNFCSVDD